MTAFPAASGLLVLACLAGAAPAIALEPDDCDLPSNVEISACLSGLFKEADTELNQIYKKAMSTIDKADYMDAEQRDKWADTLRDAQRAWITFKETDCGELVFYEWWGGTGAGIASLGCQIDATRARAGDLKSRYQID